MPATTKSSTRQYLSRAVWKKHIADYKNSGLSQSDYATKHNLVLPTFRNWVHRLQREQRQQDRQSFVPVAIKPTEVSRSDTEQPTSHNIQITLPNGIQCSFPTDYTPKLILPWIEYLRVLP